MQRIKYHKRAFGMCWKRANDNTSEPEEEFEGAQGKHGEQGQRVTETHSQSFSIETEHVHKKGVKKQTAKKPPTRRNKKADHVNNLPLSRLCSCLTQKL